MLYNVLQYLEKQEKENSDKKAIIEKDGEFITFSQLARKAREVGSFLGQYKLKNKAIPVFTNQSINSIILFFGVLYSGNYYVPIDVETPRERIKLIIDSCNAQVCCGSEVSFDKTEIPYVTISQMLGQEDEQFIDSIRKSHVIKNPLYMVYTSGSTGVPKGVIKSHSSMINFIESFVETFEIKEEVIANQTPFYFDASSKDIYLMLKTGSTLNIVPKELFMFPVKLIDFLNERRVSYICWVPSALAILSQLNAFKTKTLDYVKNVFFVGEVMQIKHLNYWRNKLPNVRYVNLYGSSEMAGICSYYIIDKEFDLEEKLPIGKPLLGTEMFLLDEEDKLVTGSGVGEICVRSPLLADGYFGDKEKTNKVFVNNALNDEYLDLILKTGDLGQYDQEGNIVYVARKDFQIKHMGHRIELTEIEMYANALEFIDASCCVYDQKRNKLVLFFTLSSEIEDVNKEITTRLKTKLPEYMIPNRYIKLESMPKNKNGKIDRTNLKNLI